MIERALEMGEIERAKELQDHNIEVLAMLDSEPVGKSQELRIKYPKRSVDLSSIESEQV